MDRLYKLNIPSLEYRRLEFDLVMVFKILHKLVDLKMENFFTFYESPYNTRRHKFCLKVNPYKCLQYKNSFANRVVELWNKLPSDIVSCNNINIFKQRLKNFDLRNIAKMIIL